MGLWYLVFVGIIIGIVFYAWVLYSSHGRFWPIFILLILTAAFIIGMILLQQGWLALGTGVSAFATTVFYLITSPERSDEKHERGDRYLYKVKCWNCGTVYDVRSARSCRRCHQHFVCPKCHACRCENPAFDPEAHPDIDEVKKHASDEAWEVYLSHHDKNRAKARKEHDKAAKKRHELALATAKKEKHVYKESDVSEKDMKATEEAGNAEETKTEEAPMSKAMKEARKSLAKSEKKSKSKEKKTDEMAADASFIHNSIPDLEEVERETSPVIEEEAPVEEEPNVEEAPVVEEADASEEAAEEE